MRNMFIILGEPILAGEQARYSGMQCIEEWYYRVYPDIVHQVSPDLPLHCSEQLVEIKAAGLLPEAHSTADG